jgi:hypothetical protein
MGDSKLSEEENWKILRMARQLSPVGKIPPGYKVKPSTEFKNYKDCLTPINGLFTDHFIKAHTLIGEYRGRILSNEQSDAKSRGSRVYFFQIFGDNNEPLFVIDGGPISQSSFLRYVNSPYDETRANCVFEQLENRILLSSIVDIPANTELTAWYGPNTKSIIAGEV